MMPERRRLVLDANILIRAVFGTRVRELLARHCETVEFFVAAAQVAEARRYVDELAARRGLEPGIVAEALSTVLAIVQCIEDAWLEPVQIEALERIGTRDPADWPAVALAIVLECPIWTEDQDFFGSGVATWTTATVEIYLRG